MLVKAYLLATMAVAYLLANTENDSTGDGGNIRACHPDRQMTIAAK